MKRTRSSADLIAARELLGWSRATVAVKLQRSGVMVEDAERGRGGEENRARLIALYEAAGVEFLPDGQVRIKTDGAR